MRKYLATFLVASFVSAYANADMTGTKLRGYLIDFNNSSSSLYGAYGAGYVMGVADTLTGIMVCSPTITVKQLTSVVLAYINSNPDMLEKSGDVLVGRALTAKWPCEKKEAGSTPPPAHKPAPKPMPKSESPF